MSRRPSPKDLLEYVQKEERGQGRGKLKIFLGAAPGVGKTYAMLEEALVKLKEGIDVVAGVVEPHGRKETQAFLDKLEELPRKKIEYKEKEFQEFDIDAALNRNPQLLLVDEMAHTNVPGSRHKKRWQDILELLDKGIDVYTTLNVQHVESLNNIVSQITGITPRETVPDTILENANAIELIDFPPDDLIRRLEEGKVYIPEDARLAQEHFFRKSNLTALRELALRVTGDQVNVEVLLHRQGEFIEKIWPTRDRLLVCIAPNSNASKLIRATYRMAKALRGEWFAVFVETPQTRLSMQEKQALNESFKLAEQLGGEAITIGGSEIVQEIIHFARDKNITKIILGKKTQSKWLSFFKSSLADELLRRNIEIDLFILRGEKQKLFTFKGVMSDSTVKWKDYFIAILTVAFCTAVNLIFYQEIDKSTAIMLFLLGSVFVSSRGFWGPALCAALLNVVSFLFFISPPKYSFLAETQYLIPSFVMLFVSLVIAHLTVLTKRQAESSRLREKQTSTLHLLTKKLARHRGIHNLIDISINYISEVFDCSSEVFLPDENRKLKLASISETNEIVPSSKELSVAQWVYDNAQMAGFGTQTLPDSESIYLPLMGTMGPIGVISVKPKEKQRFLIPEEFRLLEGISNQVALALEVDRLHEETRHSETKAEIERVRQVLIKYITANMHVPLVDIMVAANSLLEMGHQMHSPSIEELATHIYSNSENLNHLINNLIQIARLESTESLPARKLHSLDLVVKAALKGLSRMIGDRKIQNLIPETFPKISFNKVFLEQVFLNIIENALKYSPEESPIIINAIIDKNRALISIEDMGPGVALEDINKIFEKFYRGQKSAETRGMGLGLAICQRIIRMHGGEIWAENKREGGAIFKFTLPVKNF